MPPQQLRSTADIVAARRLEDPPPAYWPFKKKIPRISRSPAGGGARGVRRKGYEDLLAPAMRSTESYNASQQFALTRLNPIVPVLRAMLPLTAAAPSSNARVI